MGMFDMFRKAICRFNVWYDTVPDPWRLLIMLGLLLPGITMANFGSAAPLVCVMGGLWLMFWLCVRMAGRAGIPKETSNEDHP